MEEFKTKTDWRIIEEAKEKTETKKETPKASKHDKSINHRANETVRNNEENQA